MFVHVGFASKTPTRLDHHRTVARSCHRRRIYSGQGWLKLRHCKDRADCVEKNGQVRMKVPEPVNFFGQFLEPPRHLPRGGATRSSPVTSNELTRYKSPRSFPLVGTWVAQGGRSLRQQRIANGLRRPTLQG